MFIPRIFEAPSAASVQHFIQEHSFASLISASANDFPIATHTPLMLHEIEDVPYLFGHISIANEQKISLVDQKKVTAIFMAQHAYISSSWYDHVNVPTWNYIAVHVSGYASELTLDELKSSLSSLVSKYEKGRKGAFSMDQMSEKELNSHLRGVHGFKIKIEKIEAAYKLSQNRDQVNHQEIIAKLRESENPLDRLIADDMERVGYK